MSKRWVRASLAVLFFFFSFLLLFCRRSTREPEFLYSAGRGEKRKVKSQQCCRHIPFGGWCLSIHLTWQIKTPICSDGAGSFSLFRLSPVFVHLCASTLTGVSVLFWLLPATALTFTCHGRSLLDGNNLQSLALAWPLAVNLGGFKTVCVQILLSPFQATPGK